MTDVAYFTQYLPLLRCPVYHVLICSRYCSDEPHLPLFTGKKKERLRQQTFRSADTSLTLSRMLTRLALLMRVFLDRRHI